MTAKTNKSAARCYFERVINHGDMLAADKIFSHDIQFHYPLGDLHGAEAVKVYLGAIRTAFPDIQFTVADLFSDDNRTAARWSFVGTQTGEFRGNPPTNKKASVPGITIFGFQDGRIVEMWVVFDPTRLIGD